jgi:flagellar motor component MotA
MSQAVDKALGQLLPSFAGLNEKNAKKIVKSSKKSLSKLFKEFNDLVKKQEKELAKEAAKKAKKEGKIAEKIAKSISKEAKEKKKDEMVQLVVDGNKPAIVAKPVSKAPAKKK